MSIPRYWQIFGHCPLYGSYLGPWPSIRSQYNVTTLKPLLRLLRLEAFFSKIRSMTKWPICSLKCQNAISIWYFDKNEPTCDFGGHIVLKQPRNLKLDFKCAYLGTMASLLQYCLQKIKTVSQKTVKSLSQFLSASFATALLGMTFVSTGLSAMRRQSAANEPPMSLENFHYIITT